MMMMMMTAVVVVVAPISGIALGRIIASQKGRNTVASGIGRIVEFGKGLFHAAIIVVVALLLLLKQQLRRSGRHCRCGSSPLRIHGRRMAACHDLARQGKAIIAIAVVVIVMKIRGIVRTFGIGPSIRNIGIIIITGKVSKLGSCKL